MRIALIAPPWYTIPPSGYGGIEWVVALLADGLTDRGHEVKAPHLAIEAARRAGRRLVMCATTKNEREQTYWAQQV